MNSTTAQAPPEIQWFKTQYVTAEDRLRFTCTLKTGDTDSFWLTQRLANALAKNLVEWLDKTLAEDRFPDLAHRLAQRSATAKPPKRPQEPITDAPKPGWLVDAIDIKRRERILTLVFKDAQAAQCACIHFDAQHLRRWLKVLHAQYLRSGWQSTIWPGWITDAATEKPAAQPGLLH
jgi:hypothetical protein